jgi:hypothetical protein
VAAPYRRLAGSSLLEAAAPGPDAPDGERCRQASHLVENIDAQVMAASLHGSMMPARALIAARPAMPGWMGDVVLKIQAARHG